MAVSHSFQGFLSSSHRSVPAARAWQVSRAHVLVSTACECNIMRRNLVVSSESHTCMENANWHFKRIEQILTPSINCPPNWISFQRTCSSCSEMGQQYCYHHHHHHNHLIIIIIISSSSSSSSSSSISIPSTSLLTLGPDSAVTSMHLRLNSVRTQCGFTQKVVTKWSVQNICLVYGKKPKGWRRQSAVSDTAKGHNRESNLSKVVRSSYPCPKEVYWVRNFATKELCSYPRIMTKARNLPQFKLILAVFCYFHALKFEDYESMNVTCVLAMTAVPNINLEHTSV